MRIFNEEKTQELYEPDLDKGYLRPDKLLIEHHLAIPEKIIKSVEQVKEELETQGKEVNLRTRQGDDGSDIKEYYVVTEIFYKDGVRFGNSEDLVEAVIEEGKEAWDEYEDIQVYVPYTEEEQEEYRVAMMKAQLPQKIASIAFVQMAEKGEIDDVTVTECVYAFAPWQPNVKYQTGNLREYKGALYRCISAHTSQADWTPDVSVSLWKEVGDPREEYPEWSQPIGAFDTYKKGDKVTHNEEKWVSTVDNNVWEPGIYGWDNVNE